MKHAVVDALITPEGRLDVLSKAEVINCLIKARAAYTEYSVIVR